MTSTYPRPAIIPLKNPTATTSIFLAELMQKVLPQETAEEGYRRGYADGFIVAVNYMHDWPSHLGRDQLLDRLLEFRPSQLGMEQLLDRMFDFWQEDLMPWRNGDCTREVPPPDLTIP
jgi:hypothetical protein